MLKMVRIFFVHGRSSLLQIVLGCKCSVECVVCRRYDAILSCWRALSMKYKYIRLDGTVLNR